MTTPYYQDARSGATPAPTAATLRTYTRNSTTDLGATPRASSPNAPTTGGTDMTDWTTCRVVRDRDGDLWFRGCDSDDLWTANTNCPDVFLTTDEVLAVFGPLTPVLDADGLPVVHTVGDLTARHQLARPRIRVAGREGKLKIVKPSDAYPGTVTLIWGDCWEDAALEEPCEVLPLTATAADLGIKSASGHRSTRRATQSEAAASSFEVQRLLERAIEIKQGGSNE